MVTPIQQVSGLGKQLECWERAEDQPGGNEGTTPSVGSSESKDIYVESPQLLGELWKEGAWRTSFERLRLLAFYFLFFDKLSFYRSERIYPHLYLALFNMVSAFQGERVKL